jgi:hypothetical protein
MKAFHAPAQITKPAQIKIQVPICLVNWKKLNKCTYELEEVLPFLPLDMIGIIVVYAHLKTLITMTISLPLPTQDSHPEQSSRKNGSTFTGLAFETNIHQYLFKKTHQSFESLKSLESIPSVLLLNRTPLKERQEMFPERDSQLSRLHLTSGSDKKVTWVRTPWFTLSRISKPPKGVLTKMKRMEGRVRSNVSAMRNVCAMAP